MFFSKSVPFLYYRKSPPPYGEGLNFRPNHLYTAYRSAVNFQPDHLYTTYRSVVNFLCTYILARTKQKVNRTFYYNFMPIRHKLCNISTPIKQIYNQANYNFVLSCWCLLIYDIQLSICFSSTIGFHDLPPHNPFGICSIRTGYSFLNSLEDAPNNSCPTLESAS